MPSDLRSEFKELVRSRTDIVQLVGARVALQSQRGGREFVGLCPFHDDHRPSFRVDPERQSYKCWACGEGGDCFAFVQKIENVAFLDALELLATRANLEMPRRTPQDASSGKPRKKELLDALTWAEGEFHTFLRTSSQAAVARDYLQSRSIAQDTIDRFHIGYAPFDWQFLQNRSRGRFTPAQLVAARLIVERADSPGFRDFFVDRVLFPIRDAFGRTVAFGGRVLPNQGPSNLGKYINSQDSPLFAKNNMLYALDAARAAIVERDAAVVTEGYADCIMAHQFGITNAVATLGTALTDNHVAILKRFTRKVVLVFDGDEAGRKAAEKSLPRFVAQDVDLRILTLSEAKDPADFLVARGAAAFEELIADAPEAWEYKLNLCMERTGLTSVDARDQVVAETLELFSQAPHSTKDRENLVLSRLAHRVGLTEKRIREILVNARRVAANARTAASSAKSDSSVSTVDAPSSKPFDLLESELLEIILCDPAAASAIRAEVGLDDFRNQDHRRLLEICYQLLDEGVSPSYETLMSSADGHLDLKRLVVSLDGSARDKGVARKLRLDPQTDGALRPSLLGEALGTLKQRRRVEAHELSKGRLASQSGTSGTLDPAQIELLRRATEIHGERATARSTT